MGLTACPVKGKKKSADICEAFVAGAPKGATGLVFYGVDESNFTHYAKAVRNGITFYYIDNSYFDALRGTQFRVTRNKLQVHAIQEPESDGVRFARMDLQIKPMQENPAGHWVLIEQSPSFMRFVGAPDWFHRTLMWAEGTDRPVRVRRWDRDKLHAQRTLLDDLEGAWGLLTHSSAAAVTAMLEGIPPQVEHTHAVAHVVMSNDNRDQRLRAMRVLADNQFSLTEMKEGLAWAKVGS